jgi:hypothetical protein
LGLGDGDGFGPVGVSGTRWIGRIAGGRRRWPVGGSWTWWCAVMDKKPVGGLKTPNPH